MLVDTLLNIMSLDGMLPEHDMSRASGPMYTESEKAQILEDIDRAVEASTDEEILWNPGEFN